MTLRSSAEAARLLQKHGFMGSRPLYMVQSRVLNWYFPARMMRALRFEAAVRRAAVALVVVAHLLGIANCAHLRPAAVPADNDAARSSERSAAVAEGPVVGDLKLHEIRSQVFSNSRMLRVLLPAGYDAPENRERRYPVLYLNDGQNLFDARTSVFNSMEWRVDETVRMLTSSGRIVPIIVVGIDNAGRGGRFKEYFPWVDQYLSPPEPNPQGRHYPDFLIREVIPLIETKYRVVREASGRGLGGSSAGALAALYTVIARPGIFGRLLIESPSIYVDDGRILKEAVQVSSWPDRIYLGAGTNEDNRPTCDPTSRTEAELARDLRRLQQLLTDKGVDHARIKLTITPCATHDESAWATRLPDALTFLYGPRH